MKAPTRALLGRACFPVALAFALACGGGDSNGPSKDIDGAWKGGTSTQNFNLFVDINLVDAGGHISGGGTLSGSFGCDIQVTGSRTNDRVNLAFTCPGYEPVNFSGHVSSTGNSIPGSISGSGFTGSGFDLIKQ